MLTFKSAKVKETEESERQRKPGDSSIIKIQGKRSLTKDRLPITAQYRG